MFSYAIPAELAESVVAGARVTVPFARMKSVEGYVLGFTGHIDFPVERLRPVLSVCDPYPVLTAGQLELLSWMQEKYHCLAIHILRLFLPAQLRGGRVSPKYTTVVTLSAPDDLQAQLSGLNPESKQYKILSLLLAESEGAAEKEYLTDQLGDITSPLKTLGKKGLIALSKEDVYRQPYAALPEGPHIWHTLLPGQQAAFNDIFPALQTGGRFLLHGITGSGKTEIYMHLIREVLALGKTALVLVPEISLTPQMLKQFRSRFGAQAAVLHSALGAGERYDEWRRIRTGEARVVLGARSAVFAPLENLGLVVVDEAHEQTYQSENQPFYNALEVARFRAEKENAAFVLGSATPTVAQYYAAKKGEFRLVSLTERTNKKPLPEILLVDMKTELAMGNRSIFSRALYQALAGALERGEQAILFLNRRGHSTVVTCRACGEAVKCPFCDVSLTFHLHAGKGKNRLQCHYCGHEQDYPKACPACGSKYIKYLGAGTERVEAECQRLFPGVKTLRMDNDTTRQKDAHAKIYEAFINRQAQILVGTQMVAKGLDFPHVSLVGVISVDAMLNLPDYRARERTFSLLTQVAGRAGRAEKAGSVVIQTYTPRHFAITEAVQYNFEGFFQREIIERSALMYPPFSRYLRVLMVGAEEEAVKAYALNLQKSVGQYILNTPDMADKIIFFECTEAPISRLRSLFRYHLLLKLAEPVPKELEDALFFICEKEKHKDIFLTFEMNPSNLF